MGVRASFATTWGGRDKMNPSKTQPHYFFQPGLTLTNSPKSYQIRIHGGAIHGFKSETSKADRPSMVGTHLLETKHTSSFFRAGERARHSQTETGYTQCTPCLSWVFRSFQQPPLSLWYQGRNNFIFSTLFTWSGSAKGSVGGLAFPFSCP